MPVIRTPGSRDVPRTTDTAPTNAPRAEGATGVGGGTRVEGATRIEGVDARGVGAVGGAGAMTEAQQASAKLRELVKSGELKKWYGAVIGAVDNPALKA